MTVPRVSVIIPTHKRPELLMAAVQSVLDQTYADFEVLVVDDGSGDDTQARIEALADRRVRYLHQAQAGVSAARNHGIREARGEYIAFLDDDDLFETDKLARQVAYLDEHPEAGMVYCAYALYSSDGTRIESHPTQGAGWLYRQFLWACDVATPCVMIRREVLADVGGFDETLRLAEDAHLWIRIARRYPIGEITTPLTRVRWHERNTRRDNAEILNSFLKIIRENKAASPEIEWLFWRRLLAFQYGHYGLRQLNEAGGPLGMLWGWFLRGMLQWPFNRRLWLLGGRLLSRSIKATFKIMGVH